MLNAAQACGTAPAVLETIDSADFCKGMRQLAGACVVIATGDDHERAGLTATAVCSITANPPRLLICVNRSVRAHEVIKRAGAFSINLLCADQEPVARRFAGMVEGVFGEARFDTCNWRTGTTGVPVFDDALISFECRLVEQVPASTHDMFIGEVVGLAGQQRESGPLVYFNSQFAALQQP